MKSPILGGDSVSRSRNLADSQLWNLYPEIVETKDGKAIGALYGTPGLDLKATAGVGPIRGGGMATMDGTDTAYIVSGTQVYSLDTSYNLTLLGSLPNPLGSPVSMANNGSQMIIFDGVGGYLVPGGYPLTGGSIGAGGAGYAGQDTILLTNTDGTSTGTAQVTVNTVSGSAVASFSVSITGAFNPKPTSFSQFSTSGSGSGFTLTSPTYGAFNGVYTVPLPFSGSPVSGAIIDNFGLVNVAGSLKWYQSALTDLSIWPSLTFGSADATADPIVALSAIHREAWLLKQKHFEIWIDAGQAGFAFQRLQGVAAEVGCAAPFSVSKFGETLVWLARTSDGRGVFVRTRGYEVIPISSQGIDYEIQKYTNISDAIGYSYQQGGHVFYVVTFPSAGATWAYDLTASGMSGIPMWHRRSSFVNGAMTRHFGNAHAELNGMHLIGDYRNGNIYAFNLDTYTDNGNARKWLRSWRALKEARNDPTTFSSLQIDMETGVSVPAGTDPLCMLRWSDDGGNRWSSERFAKVGAIGKTAQRVKFNRMGTTRRNFGLDRIFELSATDQFRPAIIGAEVEVE